MRIASAGMMLALAVVALRAQTPEDFKRADESFRVAENVVDSTARNAARDSASPWAHYFYGQALREARRLRDAANELERAASLSGDDPHVLAARGLVDVMAFDADGAAKWYERAAAKSAPDARPALADAAKRNAEFAEDVREAARRQKITASAIALIALAALFFVRRRL